MESGNTIIKLFGPGFLDNPVNLLIAAAGLIGLTYIVMRYAGNFKLFGLQLHGRIDGLNEQVRNSMKTWDVMRDKVWELYTPIKNFITATIMRGCGSLDPLLFEIVNRQLDVEVWRLFRKRFFENHFYEIAEEPARLKREVGELAMNMRYTIVNALTVKRSNIWDFAEDKVLTNADMEALRGLIEIAIEKMHTAKKLMAKDSGTDVEEINAKIRGRNMD